VKSRILFAEQSLEGPLPADLDGVSRDSRQVAPGQAFVAQADGEERQRHLAEASARGAAAIIAEPRTPHARWAFARASCAAHGLPLTAPLLAVTGTKGKSTVVHFAQAALGPGAARIGTVGWHDGVNERPNPQTTPPPDELHRFLAGLPAGCPGVAMEASSHGLDQHRLAGLRLAGLAVTNIGRDHLDYHGTTAAYVHAKLRAARLLAPGGLCVINADDEHAHVFAHAALCAGARVIALGVGRGGHHRLPGCGVATAFRHGPAWMLDAPGAEVDLPVRLPGGFNAWNAAAAVLLAEAAGVPLAEAARRLADAPPVPGRLELLARAPLTYVDYAHTPESLALAIAALREAHPGRRLAVVFGCGGDRDNGKRAPMGAAAAAADLVVLTDDNPRSEDPARITAQIASGMPRGEARIEHDRGRAIAAAREAVGSEGVVLVAGKGHETEQKFRDRTVAWDDRAFVRGLEAG
jgi:UDP-N-acetylmuramoyl-L-alanyl-D-glutamate--2,6-diaminopimelate ligase